MKGIDMLKKNRSVVRENKNRKNALKKTTIDKDKNICPVCGWELVDSPAGMWCVNPEREVLDDADHYKQEDTMPGSSARRCYKNTCKIDFLFRRSL
jgi:RNA polymerase subunit RPABC4/transcription elongation factor Spt4